MDRQGKLIASIKAKLPNLLNAGQGGLLEVILTPDFNISRRIILSYVCGSVKANSVCLASAILADNKIADIQQIFRAQPDRKDTAHFGGRMVFLPDNTLILTLGDGFDYREQAQNPANHLGKILRLNIDGSAPTDNPFIEKAGYAPEIYTFGHRNVQGIVYDTTRGVLLSHEHGPRGGDELNEITAGQNYGWPVATHGLDYTGARVSPFTEFSGMTAPLFHWTPSIAPAGMTLYQSDLFPQWQGNIFVAALASKRLHRLKMNGNQVVDEVEMLAEVDLRLRDVRSGPDGALYILTDSAQGKLIKISPQR